MEDEVKYQKGDLFWDKTNNTVVTYGDEGNQYVPGTNTATEIPLNETIFEEVLGFEKDGYGGYKKDSIQIDKKVQNPGHLYYCKNEPVGYLSDIQHIAKTNGVDIDIDKDKLVEIMKSKTT